MAALHVSDIDLDAREISINRTFDFHNSAETTPKTESSNRSLYIQDQLLPVCERMMFGKKPDDLLTGTRLYEHRFTQKLKEASKGVTDKNVTAHSLRHTHVALLAEHYVPLEVISKRLGHYSSATTASIYYHVSEKLRDKENERLRTIKLF